MSATIGLYSCPLQRRENATGHGRTVSVVGSRTTGGEAERKSRDVAQGCSFDTHQTLKLVLWPKCPCHGINLIASFSEPIV